VLLSASRSVDLSHCCPNRRPEARAHQEGATQAAGAEPRAWGGDAADLERGPDALCPCQVEESGLVLTWVVGDGEPLKGFHL
jgi:hypothetical protein